MVLNGEEAFVWGIEQEPLLDYRLADGRWFTDAEEQDEAQVAVVERNIAQRLGIEVDDDVSIDSRGPAPPTSVSSAWPTTSRRTAPRSSSR